MPEWTVCPQCQLKHSRRPDGLCPRCRTAVGEPTEPAAAPPPPPVRAPAPPRAPLSPRAPSRAAGGAAPPTSSGEALPDVYDGRPLGGSTQFTSSRPAPSDAVSLGARIGGGILVANGLALLIEAGLNVTLNEGGKPPLPTSRFPLAILFDLLLGGMLLTGNAKGLPWAKVRVVLGAVVLPALFFMKGESLLAGLQIVFLGGLALLLFGEAGRIRIAAGLLGTGFALALETVGLFGIVTGTAPLAQLQLAASVEGDPVEVVEGVACGWRVTTSGGRWYLRKAEAVARDNPQADRWLVRPDKDAHVLVIAERLEQGIVVDMDRFAEVVLGNARKSAPDLEVLGSEPLNGGGNLIHTRGTVNGLAVETYYGLYASEPWIFQIVAFAGRRQFDAVKEELGAIVESFEAPSQ